MSVSIEIPSRHCYTTRHQIEKGTSAIMPKIKFTYFDIEAKGELARLLLHAGNFDFEDNRIPRSEWSGELKKETTFGHIV